MQKPHYSKNIISCWSIVKLVCKWIEKSFTSVHETNMQMANNIQSYHNYGIFKCYVVRSSCITNKNTGKVAISFFWSNFYLPAKSVTGKNVKLLLEI